MMDEIITLRISRKHAAFLQANLSMLATTTRQAMTRPGLEMERRSALGSRAFSLESIEDAVRCAMLDVPKGAPRSARGPEFAQPCDEREYRRLSAA